MKAHARAPRSGFRSSAGVVGVLLATLLAACSSGPNSPSKVLPPTVPAAQVLTVTTAVTNTHFGNALPSDFKVSVSYDGAAATTSTVDGSPSGVSVQIPHGVTYRVTVAPMDGYTVSLSDGCAGSSTSPSAACQVTATDIEMTCDKTLWDPVYSKDRLKVLKACEVATGVVRATEVERDGDLEVWMTPDPKYSYLMQPGNDYSKGWFVVEIPCQLPIVQTDAIGTCDHFKGDKVRVPLAGEHIVVAAPWVEDRTHHLWGELHGARIVKLTH